MTLDALARAFRMLQDGRAAEGARAAREAVRADPANARAHLALGIALRTQGALAEARTALERAAALAPRDYAPAFELGVVLELEGEPARAIAALQTAIALRPDFAAARFSAARLLANRGRCEEALACIDPALEADPGSALGRHEKGWILHRAGRAAQALPHLQAAALALPSNLEWRLDLAKALVDASQDDRAREAYEALLAERPGDARPRIEYGRFRVARGDFAGAADLFRAAHALDPSDTAVPIYLAQAELVQGRWREGWSAYALREPRRRFEHARAARGLAYRLPRLDAVRGTDLTLVGEQGLGDTLCYLRFAPRLAAAGARLHFRGDARLVPLAERSGVFATCAPGDASSEVDAQSPILVADLPSFAGAGDIPPALPIPPLAERARLWRERLAAAGPRPWIGILWRAGTPSSVDAYALSKNIPLEALCRAIAPLGGTVFSLQRMAREGELASAGAALGAPVHDLAAANEDLDDALALVSILDRHACVSNTNVHLAASAGASADVLVPYPPEWRWGARGASPWFPSLRAHRQLPGGDWTAALSALAR